MSYYPESYYPGGSVFRFYNFWEENTFFTNNKYPVHMCSFHAKNTIMLFLSYYITVFATYLLSSEPHVRTASPNFCPIKRMREFTAFLTQQHSHKLYTVWRLLGRDVFFSFLVFLKFGLPIGLHSSCNISQMANGTFQKCFTKHHDWVDTKLCTVFG